MMLCRKQTKARNKRIKLNYMMIPQYMNVIPVQEKKPLVSWKEFTEREQTLEEKEKLFSQYPEAGKAIVTGKVSKILVLDDDGGLDKEKYSLPLTLSQSTPRGGCHYFFRWTAELEKKVTTRVGILDKVDVRGDGGYVVFYGFSKPFGSLPLALPPKWLVDLLPDREETCPTIELTPSSWILQQLSSIQPGEGQSGRTPTFCRVIGRLKNSGLTAEEIQDWLSPWAEKFDYQDRLPGLIADQFVRYPPQIETQAPVSEVASIEAFLKDQEAVEWICDGLVAKRTIVFMAGLPQTGKTWALIDLAIEVARGGKWLGKFPVKQGKVLFVDQERFKGETQRRLKSVISAKGISPKDLSSALHVKCGSTTRLNLAHSFEAFRKELDALRPELVIIDSFATFHTCQENDRQSIQGVLEQVKNLRNEFGCTFIFIHHENKLAFQREDEAGEPSIAQMAGNIAIPAAAETVFTARRHDNDSSMIYNTKNTLAPAQPPFLIKVEDAATDKSKIEVKAY